MGKDIIELSNRMKSVVSLLTPGLFVADIGCDHAYVSIYLCRNKLAKGVIAMDIGQGPLAIAASNIRNAGYEGIIETRLSDGAQRLKEGEVQAAIIAGMGGMLMEHIISDSIVIFRNMNELVLQPQSDLYHFRRFLYRNGFVIAAEDMVFEDGKYYPMMRVVPQTDSSVTNLKDEEYAYGPCLLRDRNAILREFLGDEHAKKIQILADLKSRDKSDSICSRIESLEKEIALNSLALGYF